MVTALCPGSCTSNPTPANAPETATDDDPSAWTSAIHMTDSEEAAGFGFGLVHPWLR